MAKQQLLTSGACVQNSCGPAPSPAQRVVGLQTAQKNGNRQKKLYPHDLVEKCMNQQRTTEYYDRSSYQMAILDIAQPTVRVEQCSIVGTQIPLCKYFRSVGDVQIVVDSDGPDLDYVRQDLGAQRRDHHHRHDRVTVAQ